MPTSFDSDSLKTVFEAMGTNFVAMNSAVGTRIVAMDSAIEKLARSIDNLETSAKFAAVKEELGRDVTIFETSRPSVPPPKESSDDEMDDFYELTPADYFRISAKFAKSRKIREAEEAARKSRMTKITIRVRFPDNITLETTFNPSETFQSLMDLLSKAIAHPELPFYLYTTPPKKQIKDLSQNFYTAGFVPGAILYFSYDVSKGDIPEGAASSPYIKEDIMSLNLKDLEPILEEPAKPDIKIGENGEKLGKKIEEASGRISEASSSSSKVGIPCMDRVREELSCAICLEICYEPSTTSCGHSFCRKCLRSAADKCGKKCPKCRQLISNGRYCTVNTVLWNTIQLLFPQEIESRSKRAAEGSMKSPESGKQHSSRPVRDHHGQSPSFRAIRASSSTRSPTFRPIMVADRSMGGSFRARSVAEDVGGGRRRGVAARPSQAEDVGGGRRRGVAARPSQAEDAALALRLQRANLRDI